MKKICHICGHDGENVWRDGKYYCAFCGSQIDVTRQDSNTNGGDTAEVVVSAVCPICKNADNNTLKNGKCRCALCGTTFGLNQKTNETQASATSFDTDYKAARRAELEKQKNKKLVWGIVWLLLFWPVSIYFFYKVYQITQEQSKL